MSNKLKNAEAAAAQAAKLAEAAKNAAKAQAQTPGVFGRALVFAKGKNPQAEADKAQKAAEKAQEKILKVRDKMLQQSQGIVPGPSVFADLAEIQSLCTKYADAWYKLEAEDAVGIMSKMYKHLVTSHVDKEGKERLGAILLKMYNRPDVIRYLAAADSNIPIVTQKVQGQPCMRDFLVSTLDVAAKTELKKAGIDYNSKAPLTNKQYESYLRLQRDKGVAKVGGEGMYLAKLENDDLVRALRVLANEHKGKTADEILDAVSAAFKGASLTLPERAALMLELHSKNIISLPQLVDSANTAREAIRSGLISLIGVGDESRAKLLSEMLDGVASGRFKSADDAIIGVFADQKFREDLAKSLGKESEPLLEELAKARQLKDLETLLPRLTSDKQHALAAAAEVYRNDIVRKHLRDFFGKEFDVNATFARLSAAGDLNELHKLLSVANVPEAYMAKLRIMIPGTPEAAAFANALQSLQISGPVLTEQLETVRVLSQSTKSISDAIALRGAKNARYVGRIFFKEPLTRAGGALLSRLKPIGKALAWPVVIWPGPKVIGGPGSVAGAVERRLLRSAGYGTLTLAALALYGYIGYQYVPLIPGGGREQRAVAAYRETKDNEWRVHMSYDTANKLKASETAERFFDMWFNIAKRNLKDRENLDTMQQKTALFIYPPRIDGLAKEVLAAIKTMEKAGKGYNEIITELNQMVKAQGPGTWRGKGYFLNGKELYFELLGAELHLDRDTIDTLKRAVLPEIKKEEIGKLKNMELADRNREPFSLIMDAITDGSLPRTFAAELALDVYQNKDKARKLENAMLQRGAVKYENRPSVRDSLAMAGIESKYLLTVPIAPGSLMDLYDQYAVSSNDPKVKKAFEALLERYSSDWKVAKRLNSFTLPENMSLYTDIASLAEKVAANKTSLLHELVLFNIADDIFDRFNSTTRKGAKQIDPTHIEFVYSFSDQQSGNGMLKWLRDNAPFIKNGAEMIEFFQRNSAMLEGLSVTGTGKGSIYEACGTMKDDLEKSYRAEMEKYGGTWGLTKRGGANIAGTKIKRPERLYEIGYTPSEERFAAWKAMTRVPVDVMKRKSGFQGKPTPLVAAQSENALRKEVDALYPQEKGALRDETLKIMIDGIKAARADPDKQTTLRLSFKIDLKNGPVGTVIKIPDQESDDYIVFQSFVKIAKNVAAQHLGSDSQRSLIEREVLPKIREALFPGKEKPSSAEQRRMIEASARVAVDIAENLIKSTYPDMAASAVRASLIDVLYPGRKQKSLSASELKALDAHMGDVLPLFSRTGLKKAELAALEAAGIKLVQITDRKGRLKLSVSTPDSEAVNYSAYQNYVRNLILTSRGK